MSLDHRYDFVLVFDVQDGNPNGDPDAGNLPRLDAESGHGLVTDVCLKRKIRNYVELRQRNDDGTARPGFDIYVREKAVLERAHRTAYKAIGAEAELSDDTKKGRKGSAESVERARQWMCGNFFDVRTFGAVMGLGINCGQVRGPVQITFGRSVDPIISLEHSITRMAVATEGEAKDQGGDNRTMGRKFTVPYGVYVAHGFVSAALAQQTGFSTADLDLLWESLGSMFEHDRSAARGQMATRGLYVFEHDSKLGNAPAHALFDRVTIKRAEGSDGPARRFADYAVLVDAAGLPDGVRLHRKVG
jgi:CRISPR-associated protein Csd2